MGDLPGPVSAAGDFLAGELAGLRGVLQVVLAGHHDVAGVGVVVEEAILCRGRGQYQGKDDESSLPHCEQNGV